LLHELHQATVHTLLNTPHDSSAKMKQLHGLYAQCSLLSRCLVYVEPGKK